MFVRVMIALAGAVALLSGCAEKEEVKVEGVRVVVPVRDEDVDVAARELAAAVRAATHDLDRPVVDTVHCLAHMRNDFLHLGTRHAQDEVLQVRQHGD
jgi:hypothetical protein